VCAIPRETRSSQRLVRLRSDPEGWLVDAEYSLDAYCVANETLLVRHKRVLSARRRLFGQSLGRHARWYDEVVGDGIGPLRASVRSVWEYLGRSIHWRLEPSSRGLFGDAAW
jgi:hypothetical protein